MKKFRDIRLFLGLAWILAGCETSPEPVQPQAALPASVAGPAPAPPVAPQLSPQVPTPAAPEEIGSRAFWVNPESEAAQAAERLASQRPREAAWLKQLAEQPTAVWFTSTTPDPMAQALKLRNAVAGTGHYVSAVLSALPKPDCAGFVSGGLAPQAYRNWVQSIVQGLGETPVYWIVEPEALLLTACQKEEAIQERFQLIADTVLRLKTNPKARVYLDIGIPGWLSVDEAVQRLLKAGVMAADGFALNVGRYEWTEDCLRYGQEISQKIGGKGFVIDSSRNGKGPMSREAWCNPKDRAIGQTPQAPTGIKGLDAYLWLKKPGESDGNCNGGPARGTWWEARAIELMRNASMPD